MHHRWALAMGSLGCGALVCWLGVRFIGPKYTASGRFLRYDTPGISDVFRSAFVMSADTFAGLLRSPDLLRQVGDKLTPAVPPEVLVKQIKVDESDAADSGIVAVSLAAPTPQQAVFLLNEYMTNAVAFTRDLQARQVGSVVNAYLKKEVGQMDQDIAAMDEQFRKLAAGPQFTNKLAQIGGQLRNLGQGLSPGPPPPGFVQMETERLHRALGELTELLSKHTERHPLVQQKRSEIEAIESEVSGHAPDAGLTSVAGLFGASQPAPSAPAPELDIIQSKLLSLERGRVELANREREAELLAADPPGICRVFAPATLNTVRPSWRRLKISLITLFGMALGLTGTLGLVALAELADRRLKTADDVARVTRLPVLGSVGNLNRMNEAARLDWAFRTWTMLQGRLSPSPHHGLVCGITSCSAREGRSTWIRLLADAASLTGFRVLTIATRSQTPDGESNGSKHQALESHALEYGEPGRSIEVLAPSVLSSPAQVAAQLREPDSPPMVHIPLPGWVWNLERRNQWLDALNCWRRIENLVILVELPPASVTEAVLLGSSLPNLLWLTCCGSADAGATRDQLETLRHARCRLAGAVLNLQKRRPMRSRFPRWLVCAALLAALNARPAHAQDSNGTPTFDVPRRSAPVPAEPLPATNTNLTFSVLYPWQRAA
jgi:capsular polysaccharide biosynthesis protein